MLIRVPQRKRDTFIHSTKKEMPNAAKCRPCAFRELYPLKEAAKLLNRIPGELLYTIMNSNNFFAFRMPDNEVFVHPDGVLRALRKKGAAIARKEAEACLKVA